MNKMKCYSVTCVDGFGNSYDVGVMTTDEFAAKHSAVNSLFEGRHLKTHAVSVVETDKI